MDQWYFSRASKPNLPVLLWVHGGPGASQMPAWRTTEQLEDDFIVVHWDQRGSGKSNTRDFDESTMNLDQYISDIIEITLHLKEKYNTEKIYILGHSWGTYIGLLAVLQNPEHYKAYIGLSQLVNHIEGNMIAHEELTKRIQAGRRKRHYQKKLDKLDGPPYSDMGDYSTFVKLMDKYGMALDISLFKVVTMALNCKVYSFFDFIRWLQAWVRMAGPMWEEIWEADANRVWDPLPIPGFFISGSEDYVAPIQLIPRLMNALGIPEENFYIMESSAHFPYLSNSEGFCNILKEIKSIVEESEFSFSPDQISLPLSGE